MRAIPRRAVFLAVASVAAIALVVPAMAAPPTSGPPGQQNKPAKGPEIAVEVRGTIQRATDAKGRPSFTVTAGGATWELSAGPKWYWTADNHPLAAFVGKSVLVAGTHHEGETELDVETVDGTALRPPGKPPWAGGPKVVGERHPGWHGASNGTGLGREGAPGQLKKESPAP